ncbi:SusD/RagB family nutrient-binding outer membrane lipoprotein [Jejuia pallidilutea]|uniref:SusD/RagB family nutrient-binding outer membrane lipoprotein n=1 Tax=Jejuia pallidilutea TaxID=504487 RepID=A0A090W5Q7_9FLAO|nr:SusD/RagB family nutrient-binding outer membrane lipoprotein [Jejuia pallidilutea]GAL72350.1 hypothetical protein JCM19302_3628 [Jejuia pallidilutea]
MIIVLSCTSDFEEINKNPNQFTTASPEALLTGAFRTSLNEVGGEMNLWMFASYARYAGGLQGNELHQFGVAEVLTRGYWQNLYVDVITACDAVINIYEDNPDFNNRVQVAKAWKAYTYHVIFTTWGPAPLSNAIDINQLPDIIFDSEEKGYTQILSMLKEASDNMSAEGDSFVNGQDVIYGGDMNKWMKFINTMRLKIALRISTGFPSLAQQHINEALAKGEDMLILDNSDNAILSFENDPVNWNSFYNQEVIVQNDNHIPKVNHNFMLFLTTYGDPRIEVFAAESKKKVLITDMLQEGGGSTDTISVQYAVPYLGEPLGTNANRALPNWGLNENDNPLRDYEFDNYSGWGERFMAADADYTLISAAETYFILAELNATGYNTVESAQSYYNKGIEASFSRYNLQNELSGYLSQDGIAWGTSSQGKRNYNGIITSGISDDPLEKILTQRWIAMFFQGHDGYCLQKRTRKLAWSPFIEPADRIGVDYLDFPERMVYPESELIANPVGYASGVELLGGTDTVLTKLEMNSDAAPTDWDSVPAEFNNEYISGYYGPSVDDLLAAGLVEVDLSTGTFAERLIKRQMLNDGKAFEKL